MTTPFYTGTIPFAGVDPGEPQFWPTVPGELWIGQPGAMVQLPSPRTDQYAVAWSTGKTEHGLVGNGSSVTEFEAVRRWTIGYERLVGRDLSLIRSLYRHLGASFRTSPMCYLDPEATNRLTLAQSMCGELNGISEGWITSAGIAPTFDTSIPPVAPAEYPSGVLRWVPSGSGGLLVAGGYSGGVRADLKYGCPYVPSRSWEANAWVQSQSGTPSGTVRLYGLAADGATVVATVDGPSVTLNSSAPQRMSCSINPGDLGASAFIVMALRCSSATSPTWLISCPWLTDRPDDVDAWSPGTGVARVNWPDEPSGPVGWHMGHDLSITLAEAYPGAC